MDPFDPIYGQVYTLASDLWWEWNGSPVSRPAYVRGQRVGSIGCCHPSARFPFPSHEAAIRFFLEPFKHPMPDLTAHRQLTPADVLDLRVSVRSRVPDIGSPPSVPCVHYNAGLDGYELRQGTVCLCWSRDLSVVAALLRGERFQPGFIKQVLDATFTPEELTLDADAREQSRRNRADQEARTRARIQAEEDEARQRRLYASGPVSAPPDITLDDLFDPTFRPDR